jgi:hypothetical protein
LFDIYVRNEDVSGYFSYVFEEGEVHGLVLDPCQLEVAVDVGAVGEAIAKVPIVGVAVRWDRHPPVRPNAY